MSKFKMTLAESRLVSMKDVFGTEPRFTDEFLTQEAEFAKILTAIGITDSIEGGIQCQIQTSDGKELDNLVTTSSGQRIALEAQVGISNMTHVAKLPYYMDNLRDQNEGETMIGILVAEEFTQEAIDYYTTLNVIDWFDLYLVKAVFVEINGVVAFTPQLISPTPTTNNYKAFKSAKSTSDFAPASELHKENREKLETFFSEQGLDYVIKPSTRSAGLTYRLRFDKRRVEVWLSAKGTLIAYGQFNHENIETYVNQKNDFKLKDQETGKAVSCTPHFDQFVKHWNLFISSL